MFTTALTIKKEKVNIGKFMFYFSNYVDFICLLLNVQSANEKSLDM